MNAILQSVLIFSLCCPILCPLYINAKIPAIQKKGEKAIQIRVSTFVVGEIEVAPFDLPCGGTYAHAMQAIDSIGEGWRLPSVEEMKLIFEHKDKIGFRRYYRCPKTPWKKNKIGSNKIMYPTFCII
jgi:hypothetical protein